MIAHPLDRPVWSMLTGRQAHLAEGDARAMRIDRGYGVFGAAADAGEVEQPSECGQRQQTQQHPSLPKTTPHRVGHLWGVVTGRTRHGAVRRQTRLKIRVPLVPPKPKLFFMATSIFMSRAMLAQ